MKERPERVGEGKSRRLRERGEKRKERRGESTRGASKQPFTFPGQPPPFLPWMPKTPAFG